MADLKSLVDLEADLVVPYITVRYIDRNFGPTEVQLTGYSEQSVKLVTRAELVMQGQVTDGMGSNFRSVTVPLGRVAGIEISDYGYESEQQHLVAHWLRGPHGLVRFKA